MKRLVNPFDTAGQWYKANLHTHSTTSDGGGTPSQRVAQYRGAGYQVLALTDHEATNDTTGMSNKRFLAISGMEYHPHCPTSRIGYHLIALNVPHGFRLTPKEHQHPNRCIAKVKRAGGLTFLGHPFWCGHAYEDFRKLKGLEAVEIYNTTCAWFGRACSESEWSCALDHGMCLPIVGVDDTHSNNDRDLFGCWTWLRMRSLSVANVLKAVRTGACYASTGPKIHYFGVKDGKLRLRCSPAAKIQFASGPALGRPRIAKEGKTVTGFSIDVPDWPYARAVVTDPTGRQAWANPISL